MASVFSQIIAGNLPGHFVYQDEDCVAIMTIQPVNAGHVLVIPRDEISHWDDLSDELLCHLNVVAKKIAKAIKRAFVCQRVGLVVAGFEVPHVHLHVIPVNDLSDFHFTGLAMADSDALAQAAEKIRNAL